MNVLSKFSLKGDGYLSTGAKLPIGQASISVELAYDNLCSFKLPSSLKVIIKFFNIFTPHKQQTTVSTITNCEGTNHTVTFLFLPLVCATTNILDVQRIMVWFLAEKNHFLFFKPWKNLFLKKLRIRECKRFLTECARTSSFSSFHLCWFFL